MSEPRPATTTGAPEWQSPASEQSLEDIDGRGLSAGSIRPEYLEGRAPEQQRGASGAAGRPDRYYDYAPLRRPSWKWHVPLYFFVAGAAAGAQALSALAHLFGSRTDWPVVRMGRYLATPLVAFGQLLLIEDLGRPERAHHMFRIIKTRSPMSMGAWGLALFSGVSGSLFGLQLLSDLRSAGSRRRPRPPGSFGSAFALPLSIFVGGYTGALLSATSVPLWAKARGFLAPLFLASAFATGTAAVAASLELSGRGRSESRRPLAQVMAASLAAELATLLAMEQELGALARHLASGSAGVRHRGGVALGVLVPLAILSPALLAGHAPDRGRLVLATGCALLGGLIMRISITTAGNRSADSAESYWDWTRP